MKNIRISYNKNLDRGIIVYGRSFLKTLVSVEQEIIFSQISTLSKDNMLLLQIQNWQCVVALMIRKLSAYFSGETDYDYEIVNPVFIIQRKEKPKDDIDSI